LSSLVSPDRCRKPEPCFPLSVALRLSREGGAAEPFVLLNRLCPFAKGGLTRGLSRVGSAARSGFFGARQSTRKTTAPLSNHNRGSVVSPAEVTTLRRSSFSAVEQPVRLLKAVGLSSHRAVQRSPHLYPFFRYISQRELESSRRKPPSKGGKIEAAH